MKKFVCIHGHFYQPPRENPWLEEVELADSASPYHDWNARITAECYGPNAASRILDASGEIADISNNYEKISFNFGPTLLSWMQRHAPAEYRSVIDADRAGRRRFSGHGPALAQVYSHLIMPLASGRDRRTQVLWGKRDFASRFGREPEGMWLPEMAVDTETLEALAECGIAFTILSGRQASKVRPLGSDDWENVEDGRIDPRRAYAARLPSGRSIALFFSDMALSANVSYGELLQNGENLAHSLLAAFDGDGRACQLVSIATDGETFGHHHRFGDMALAYCLNLIETRKLARITNYAEFLALHPPEHEVRVFENSSWSCIHGVERWRADCGCNAGGHPGWNQQWREPLRQAMDFLSRELASAYEREMAGLAADPWAARDGYIEVILDRSPDRVRSFLEGHAGRALSQRETVRMLKLLEMQRHAMLMLTSCGWFFDEISGIEGVQVMMYAARALQIARTELGMDLEPQFTRILARAQSNIPDIGDGAAAYAKYVKPAEIDLLRVGAHYAVSSLFTAYDKSACMYSYCVDNEVLERREVGSMKLIAGRARLRSTVTLKESAIDFAVLHMMGSNIYGGMSYRLPEERFTAMLAEIKASFQEGDICAVIRTMSGYFGTYHYSLWHLFRDEQRQIVSRIYSDTAREIEFAFRYIYERYYPLAQAMAQINMPLPKTFAATAEFILLSDLAGELERDPVDCRRLENLIHELKRQSIPLYTDQVSYAVTRKVNRLIGRLEAHPQERQTLRQIRDLLRIFREVPQDFEFWKAQNAFFNLKKKNYGRLERRAAGGDGQARAALGEMADVARLLDLQVAR